MVSSYKPKNIEYACFPKLDYDFFCSNLLEEYRWHPIEEKIIQKRIFSNGVLNYTIYYVNENYIQIVNSSGTFTEKYVYQDGTLIAQVNTDGQKQVIHSDNKGSNTLITASDGSVVENSFYSPYGEIISGGKSSRFSYEGKEYDSLTDDYNFNFRKFDLKIPIGSQPDTLIKNVYDPQLLNRYTFERNNAYRYIDPSGHIANPYELPAIQASPQTSAGGILGALEEGNTVWGNIQIGRESTRQEILKDYGKYYEVTDVLTKEGRQSGGPTYEEIQEWKEARSLRNKNWLERSFSVEKSSVISTQKTSYYDNIIGNLGSSDLYKNVAALGGKVDVREKGVKVGILAVYYRMMDGKQILRYQRFNDEREKKSWEKSHDEYKLLSTDSG